MTDAPTAPLVLPIAHPLDDFYAQAQMALPAIEGVAGPSVPEPYRSLLVHESDMTSTLARFHNGVIRLKVLSRQVRGDFYYREVVLYVEETGKAVEFGAIKINLQLFSLASRREILEERLPLGYVLSRMSVPYASRPKAFLKIRADEFINTALGLTGSPTLYGRRNTLLNPEGRSLAEIVEILPP